MFFSQAVRQRIVSSNVYYLKSPEKFKVTCKLFEKFERRKTLHRTLINYLFSTNEARQTVSNYQENQNVNLV